MYTDTHSACGTAEVEFYNPIVNVFFVCMCVCTDLFEAAAYQSPIQCLR